MDVGAGLGGDRHCIHPLSGKRENEGMVARLCHLRALLHLHALQQFGNQNTTAQPFAFSNFSGVDPARQHCSLPFPKIGYLPHLRGWVQMRVRFAYLSSAALRSIAVGSVISLGACASPTPVAKTYPMTFQQKMQSASHWDVLAKHVAEDMAKWLPTSGAAGRPLAIRATAASNDFARGFEGFLITRLHELGFAIATEGYDSYRIEHEAQVIHHKGKAISLKPGTFTLLGSGVAVAKLAENGVKAGAVAGGAVAAGIAADVAAGYVTSETSTEVIVTVTAADQGLVTYRRSFVFYINDADASQYGGNDTDILMIIDGAKANALQEAWRTADQRCGERGRGKAMLRANTPAEDKRELRFDCNGR